MLVIPHSHSFFVCWWWINLTQWTKFHLEILRETQDLFCGLYIQQISATFLFYLKLFWFLLDFEKIYRVIHLPNICSIKFRSKHSANTICTVFTTKFNGTDFMYHPRVQRHPEGWNNSGVKEIVCRNSSVVGLYISCLFWWP